MCDFFFYTAPEEQNTVLIFNVDMREGPHVRMMRLRMLLSRFVVSHVNSNFERMI